MGDVVPHTCIVRWNERRCVCEPVSRVREPDDAVERIALDPIEEAGNGHKETAKPEERACT